MHDLVFVMQQRLAEPRIGHAQIGVVDIPLVQSGQLGVSACDLMPGLVVKRVPGGQGETQRPRGEGTGGLQMLVELDVRRGSAVIFRHGRIGREISDVEFVDQVGRERVVEHVGDERQSVQRHTVLLQPVCERRAARGAVGFAEHVFGRVPAVVFAQVRPDERAEAGDVAVHRPQFRLGRVEDLGESGTGAASGTLMRFGAIEPMSRNVVDEPGPPLKMNVTGRAGSVLPSPFTRSNAVKKMLAALGTFGVSMSIVPTVAA